MRVFLVSYAGYATGGTELLHQFCKCLTDSGIESYMLYPDAEGACCPTPEPFLKYNVKYVSQFVDADDTILVLTETQIHMAEECKKGIVMLWWLAVDTYYNYLLSGDKKITAENIDIFDLKSRKNVIHFVQSHYAKDFLEKKMGIDNSYFLMDYINDDIMATAEQYRSVFERENICLYNPKKGYETLKPVIDACRKDIQWVPLNGYTPIEMAALMCRAKVYVDFGGHPGKDRIPREAAICGCLVLTNRAGSAAYKEDVGIPECYKLQDTGDIAAVLEKIYELMDCYQEKQQEYASYRTVIAGEKAGFMQDVQTTIALLKDCVQRNHRQEIVFDGENHGKLLTSLGSAANQIGAMAAAAVADCKAGNRSAVINKLLDIDYVVQAVREAVSIELSALTEEEEL